MSKKIGMVILVMMVMMSFVGCSRDVTSNSDVNETVTNSNSAPSENESGTVSNDGSAVTNTESNGGGPIGELEVQFGMDSKTFMVTLYDNDTAAELVRNLDAGGMNLPIYHFDDFENYEVMQYYDIPSRFEIPSDPETVTSEKAGEFYYSAPNRVVLFYQDAEITGEFTKVGYMEDVEGLKDAVENNKVVPGWENKVISVNYME